MTDAEIAFIAETLELRMNEKLWESLPTAIPAQRKMQLFRVGGAFATATPKSISLQRNRVIGLGVEKEATEASVDEILNHFHAAKVKRLSWHLSPCAQSGAIAGWLEKRGFKLHHHYSKLFRDTSPGPPVETPLTVKRLNDKYADSYVKILGDVFAWLADQKAWQKATISKPGFNHDLAFDRDRPVAGAVLYVEGECAWMGWAGTIPPDRRRGAHAALIAARVRRAAELGAKWIVCETLEPLPKRLKGSYRDLVKQGFKPAYLRPIWVWEKS